LLHRVNFMPHERVGFAMRLNEGAADEYRRRHDAIWPELADLLRKCGISNYSIFLDKRTQTLFGYLERAEGHTMDALPLQPIMREWWAHMHDIMEANADNSPVVRPLVEMFHLP
jgi:L-rhamnose mutarotase